MRSVGKVAVLVLLGLGLSGCAWLFTPLQAVLTATPTSGVAPLSVTFSAAGSTGTIVSFTLDFETDGTVDYTGTDITVAVVHTYDAPGTYTATLTVQDARGRTNAATVTITVTASPTTTVSLGAIPASGPAPLDDVDFWVTINAAPGRRIVHLRLEYGDGSPDFEATVDLVAYNGLLTGHSYTDPGTYTATLTATDDEAQATSASVMITVTSPPPEITSFSVYDGVNPPVKFDDVDPTLAITAGHTVDFDFAAQAAAGREIAKYTLLCPGSDIPSLTEEGLTGNTLTRNDLMRTYATAGTYTATLQVWDDVGNSDLATLTIEVTAP
ncbi:MAG: PKD domain-containing protein [Candidatus Acetothermia bacterium]|nr:PKD domain-containing protein [Candidatus Acetothermia bacterium]